MPASSTPKRHRLLLPTRTECSGAADLIAVSVDAPVVDVACVLIVAMVFLLWFSIVF